MTNASVIKQMMDRIQHLKESDLGKIATDKGFHVWHTGGLCCCFCKYFGGGKTLVLSHESDIPEQDLQEWDFCYFQYHENDGPTELIAGRFECSLENALTYAENAAQEFQSNNQQTT